MIYKNNRPDPNPSQIVAVLIAIGLIGTFGLGAFAIHQQFSGSFGFRMKDWIEINYKGRT